MAETATMRKRCKSKVNTFLYVQKEEEKKKHQQFLCRCDAGAAFGPLIAFIVKTLSRIYLFLWVKNLLRDRIGWYGMCCLLLVSLYLSVSHLPVFVCANKQTLSKYLKCKFMDYLCTHNCVVCGDAVKCKQASNVHTAALHNAHTHTPTGTCWKEGQSVKHRRRIIRQDKRMERIDKIGNECEGGLLKIETIQFR